MRETLQAVPPEYVGVVVFRHIFRQLSIVHLFTLQQFHIAMSNYRRADSVLHTHSRRKDTL